MFSTITKIFSEIHKTHFKSIINWRWSVEYIWNKTEFPQCFTDYIPLIFAENTLIFHCICHFESENKKLHVKNVFFKTNEYFVWIFDRVAFTVVLLLFLALLLFLVLLLFLDLLLFLVLLLFLIILVFLLLILFLL